LLLLPQSLNELYKHQTQGSAGNAANADPAAYLAACGASYQWPRIFELVVAEVVVITARIDVLNYT